MEITLGNRVFSLDRLKLKPWLILEDARNSVHSAAEQGDRDALVLAIYSYLSAALSVPENDFIDLPSHEIISAYVSISNLNAPGIEFPLLKSDAEDKDVPWDYEERTWYIWAHSIAGVYGWALEYIAELEIDDAIGLMQEILTEDQVRREWDWSLSEMSLSYDETTKKTKFRPISRPSWMLPEEKRRKIPVVRIPKSIMPVGNVQGWEDVSQSK